MQNTVVHNLYAPTFFVSIIWYLSFDHFSSFWEQLSFTSFFKFLSLIRHALKYNHVNDGSMKVITSSKCTGRANMMFELLFVRHRNVQEMLVWGKPMHYTNEDVDSYRKMSANKYLHITRISVVYQAREFKVESLEKWSVWRQDRVRLYYLQ